MDYTILEKLIGERIKEIGVIDEGCEISVIIDCLSGRKFAIVSATDCCIKTTCEELTQ